MPSSLWLTSQQSDLVGYLRATLNTRGDCPSLTRSVTSTTAGPTSGVQITDEAGGTALAWITDPLNAVTLTAATWTARLWAKESSAAANAVIRPVVLKWSAAEGTTVLDDMGAVTELGTSTADTNAATETATAVSLSAGDRLVIKLYIDDASSSMVTGHEVTVSYGGLNPRAEGDTYLMTPTADTLALAGDAPKATLTRVRRCLVLEDVPGVTPKPSIPDNEAGNALLATNLQSAIIDYSRLRPRIVQDTLSGDGSAFDFPLPRLFIWGSSSVRSVEYPTGEQWPVLLDDNADFTVYETTVGRQPVRSLRFYSITPESGTDNIGVTYTTRHVHTDELDTIPADDLDAVCWLAASLVAEGKAAEAADINDTQVNADAANRRDSSQRWDQVARALRRRYETHMGLGITSAAGGVMEWDTVPQWQGDWLTHRNRWR